MSRPAKSRHACKAVDPGSDFDKRKPQVEENLWTGNDDAVLPDADVASIDNAFRALDSKLGTGQVKVTGAMHNGQIHNVHMVENDTPPIGDGHLTREKGVGNIFEDEVVRTKLFAENSTDKLRTKADSDAPALPLGVITSPRIIAIASPERPASPLAVDHTTETFNRSDYAFAADLSANDHEFGTANSSTEPKPSEMN